MTGGDLLITAALFVFLVIAVLADSINLLAGPGPISDATLASLPHFEAVKAAFVWFSRDVDPLLRRQDVPVGLDELPAHVRLVQQHVLPK